jgi:hypothetical protein
MTAKEFLGQAWRVDRLIDAKLEQVAVLRSLVTKATTTLSDMPKAETSDSHRMEDIIIKMVDMEAEIKSDIDKLLALKKEIAAAIKNVANVEHQILLELRYLAFKPWSAITSALNCGTDHVYRLHRAALSAVTVPTAFESCQ